MEEEIAVARSRCSSIIDRIGRLPARTNITDSCKRTLLKLALSELNFLYSLSPASPPANLSVNIGHLEAVVHLLEHPFVSGVSRVCKQIALSPSSRSAYVDIVCSFDKNPVWIIVSDRNPKYVSWHGCPHKSKGLKFRIEEVLAAAKSSQMMKPSSVVLFFSHGLGDLVCEKIKHEFGASEIGSGFSSFDCGFFEELDGEWLNVLPRSYRDAVVLEIKVDCESSSVLGLGCTVKDLVPDGAEPEFRGEHLKSDLDNVFSSLVSRIKSWPLGFECVECAKSKDLIGDGDIINFTTTALIALVSGISNGCTEKLLTTPDIDLRQKFKGNLGFVIGQVMSEIQSPILMELGSVIAGKRGIICETVLSEFKELISLYGGPNEKYRADELLKRLMVVPNNPSERMMCLPTTRNLALKNKVVFGTGDRWHSTALTANMAFVRAVSQTGMSLVTIEHRPRALIGD